MKGETLTLEQMPGLGAWWVAAGAQPGFLAAPYAAVQAGEGPGRRAGRDWQGGEWRKPCLWLWLAMARSWLPPAEDVGDGWGYPRLPLSLHCIFYKGAGTEQTGFQLVSVFSVVTLSIKFPALTMGGAVGTQIGQEFLLPPREVGERALARESGFSFSQYKLDLCTAEM